MAYFAVLVHFGDDSADLHGLRGLRHRSASVRLLDVHQSAEAVIGTCCVAPAIQRAWMGLCRTLAMAVAPLSARCRRSSIMTSQLHVQDADGYCNSNGNTTGLDTVCVNRGSTELTTIGISL